MASYQVMFWKHIPSQVKSWEGGTEVKRMMPDRFQVAIDAFAMKDGSTDMDAYLKTLQSLANDVSNLLTAAQAGDQTAFDAAIKAIDSDSAKLNGYDFSGMLTKAESFYSDLTDKYNAQIDLANKA